MSDEDNDANLFYVANSYQRTSSGQFKGGQSNGGGKQKGWNLTKPVSTDGKVAALERQNAQLAEENRELKKRKRDDGEEL